MQSFSAPGKALVAGGYLVLFPEYCAYSIALSSRMHSVLETSAVEGSKLQVSSPQFESEWSYSLQTGNVLDQPHPNPFIEAVVATCRAYFGPGIKGARITIWSDQGFHSQPQGTQPSSPRFTMYQQKITEVPKTGLGSSAALTVVVVAAIIRAQSGTRGPLGAEELNLVHNLSQIAHSISQGKVGSGFDVATAVYGSINYSRFPPALISDFVGVDSNAQALHTLCDSKWPFTARQVSLPSTVKILMGDVNNGSETPSMVRKILAWRDSDPRAAEIWQNLGAANLNLTQLLAANNLQAVPEAIAKIRKFLRLMSELAQVPVEPPQQTKLLDQCTAVDGVLGGVVPGAGGSDAICLLVESSKFDQAKQSLEGIEGVKWLPLEQENEGLVEEDVSVYPAHP